MNLKESILAEHSRKNCNRIIKYVGNNQVRFDELVKLFLNSDYRVIQRASWPLSYIVDSHPGLIKKHFGKIISNLRKPGLHDAAKRNTLRLLQNYPIPKKYQGEIMDTCFRNIESPNEKPAIKAFSLTILHNLSKQYPDIKDELKTVIESRWDYETAAFKSRARKILKEL